MKKLFGLLLSLGPLMLSAETVDLYVGTRAAEGIWRAELDTESGELGKFQLAVEQVSPSFVAVGASGEYWYSTAIDPKGKSGKEKGRVAAYRRDMITGQLELINSQPSMSAGPCHIGIDKTESCLFVACYGGGGVTSYKLGEDKSIGEPVSVIQHKGSSVNPKRQKSAHAHSVYASEDNRFVYVCDLGMDEVLTYSLNSDTAELAPVGSFKVQPGSGPRHMDFSSDGKKGYLLNELTMSVDVLDRNVSTGAFTKKANYPVLPKQREEMSCSEVRVSDDDQFVYTANRDLADMGRDSISVFKVLDDGKLKRIQVIPVKVWIPRHFDITPDGRCLVVAGQRADSLAVFRRDVKTGKLTFVSKKSGLKVPMWIGFQRK